MEQIKRAYDFQDQPTEKEDAAGPEALRTLTDLELVLCGGGDGPLTW